MLTIILRFLGALLLSALLFFGAEAIVSTIGTDPTVWIQLLAGGLLLGSIFKLFGRLLTRLTSEGRSTGESGVGSPAFAVSTVAAELAAAERGFPVERRARHEAAHAVIAMVKGKKDVRANVSLFGEIGGTVDFETPIMPLSDATYIDMLISFGGQIVDLEAGHYDGGSRNDMRHVTDSALLIISTDQKPAGYDGLLTTDALVRAARKEAEQLLDEHVDAVDRVTHALLKHHRLTDSDLTLLVDVPADARALAGRPILTTTNQED